MITILGGSNTQIIEENEITENLKVTVSIAFDETKLYLDVNYLQGKFTVQRHFVNNYLGVDELTQTKEAFNSEEAVKAYFGL